MEWAFRLMSEPKRLWRRYLLGAFKIADLVITQRSRLGSDRLDGDHNS
jgi:UDP-N-acetyl-D-mannosaminuronic acid transferase (WecB/TagA/CpsF family)